MNRFNKTYRYVLEQSDPATVTEEEVRTLIITVRQMFKRRNRFFSHLLSQVPIIVVSADNKQISTMAVDGKGNMYINVGFAQDLLYGTAADKIAKNDAFEYEPDDPYVSGGTDGQRLFAAIIAHELQHIFKNHIARFARTGRDRMLASGYSLANIATDLEINDELIYSWGYYLTKDAIITEPNGDYTVEDSTGKKHVINVRGLSPERIYDMLDKIIDETPQSSQGGSGDPVEIKVGDIVKDTRTGAYGEVVSIDSKGNAKVVELTEEEAKKRI